MADKIQVQSLFFDNNPNEIFTITRFEHRQRNRWEKFHNVDTLNY